MKVQGRCHCGNIRYEAAVDPATASICHCADCQMLTGSAYRATVPAPAAGFRMASGTVKTYIKTADSGNRRIHAFCPDCGTPVYSCATDNPLAYSLRIGCLDQRAQLKPAKQQWCQSALGWAMDLHGIPQLPKQ